LDICGGLARDRPPRTRRRLPRGALSGALLNGRNGRIGVGVHSARRTTPSAVTCQGFAPRRRARDTARRPMRATPRAAAKPTAFRIPERDP